MKLMEEIFFSFTFGGETLSLAAAKATLEKLQREPVVKTLWRIGKILKDGLAGLIEKHGLKDTIAVSGSDAWSFITISDTAPYSQWLLKTLFLQEMMERGILIIATHNLNYSHNEADIAKLLGAYDQVLGIMKDALVKKDLESRLKGKPLEQQK